MTAQQIEAARIAINRKIKRGGKVWIGFFLQNRSQKPAETRMGKGKGSPEYWVAPIQPGKILYELAGVDEELAVRALTLAGNKLPFCHQGRCQEEHIMKAEELRKMSEEELGKKLADLRKELGNLSFHHRIRPLEDTSRLRKIRKDIARINTVVNQKGNIA